MQKTLRSLRRARFYSKKYNSMATIQIEKIVKEKDVFSNESIDNLEQLKIELKNDRLNIPTVVDMFCPCCSDRNYAYLLGIINGRDNVFAIIYSCEVCGDTQSILICGDKREYKFGD